jgi:hypothetical protein
MAEAVDYFIPPEVGEASVLAGDITPLPANACDAFIHAYVPKGGLVWDPFCRTDTVARAAARQGKRAALSDFNPLIAFATHATLTPVSTRQLDRAFTSLAATPTMQTTLETHINSLYATVCSVCKTPAVARSYTWSYDSNAPQEKEYYCLTCNVVRQEPVTEPDLETLSHIEERGRAYWSLLERLSASGGMLQPLGQRLLDLYTPRTLYALSTIQSKLEVFAGDSAAQEVLMLALLSSMEKCLKPQADDREQHHRTILSRTAAARVAATKAGTFTETNSWACFAEACSEQRARLEREARESAYLNVAPARTSGEERMDAAEERPPLTVRQASARRMAGELGAESVDLILTAPPVIDWGDTLLLTWLWTGWLLGKDAARRFSPDYLLHPKRPNDWPWFFGAMERSLRAMAAALAPAGKLVFCFPLTGLGYLNVLVLAAAAAGLQLENIAFQPQASDVLRRPPALGLLAGYCYLRLAKTDVPQAATGDDLLERARRDALAAATSAIRERGEPTAYIWLHLAMLLRLSQSGILARLVSQPSDEATPWDWLRHILSIVQHSAGTDLVLISPSEAATTTAAEQASGEAEDAEPVDMPAPVLARQRGWWWLADPSDAAIPVNDRAEWASYTVLSTTALPTSQAVGRVVYALFPGLLTPEPGLLEACLQSYAAPVSPIHWQLRPADALAQRSHDHTEMLVLLTNLGHKLGYRVWIGRADTRQREHGPMLTRLLSLAEKLAAVENILPGATERSQLIDIIWYQNRRASHIFEVEWTVMLSESILHRASVGGDLKRYLVVPPERENLVNAKLDRMPLLRHQWTQGGWDVIRFDMLRQVARLEEPVLQDLERAGGWKHEAEAEGLQLTLL